MTWKTGGLRINIDNNLIENAIKLLALGSRNYLFCGNDASAYRAAIVYSLIGTCKAADVDPRPWMESHASGAVSSGLLDQHPLYFCGLITSNCSNSNLILIFVQKYLQRFCT